MLQTEHTCHLAIVIISCHDIFIVIQSTYHPIQLNIELVFIVESYFIFLQVNSFSLTAPVFERRIRLRSEIWASAGSNVWQISLGIKY